MSDPVQPHRQQLTRLPHPWDTAKKKKENFSRCFQKEENGETFHSSLYKHKLKNKTLQEPYIEGKLNTNLTQKMSQNNLK